MSLISNILSSKKENTDSPSNKLEYQKPINEIGRNDIGYSTKVDTISSDFIVDIKSPISELSSNIADAFELEPISSSSKNSYALIFKRNIPVRLREILFFINEPILNLQNPLCIGIAKFSHTEKEHIGIILPKPKGKSLASMIAEEDTVFSAPLITHIIKTTNDIFKQLHENNIIHGTINVNNIYIIDNKDVVIGECVSSVIGAKQPIFFETCQAAQCLHSFSKSNSDFSRDYYALGTSLYLAYKKIDYTKYETDVIEKKFHDDTYTFLNTIRTIQPDSISDCIRGFVVDDKNIRWGYDETVKFLEKQSYSVSDLINKQDLSQPINFLDRVHYTKSSLAYSLYQNWDLAIDFLKQDHVIKWLDISTSEHPVVELLMELKESKISCFTASQTVSKDDEMVIKALMILDPEAPIRTREISFYFESLGSAIALSVSHETEELTKTYINVVLSGLPTYYLNVVNKYKIEFSRDFYTEFQQISTNLRRSTIGFGLERCIYDLNPSLPCQSPILKDQLCVGVKELLEVIDSDKLDINGVISNKSLMAFVASKLDIFTPLKFNSLEKFAKLSSSVELQSLSMFSQVQKKFRIKSLNHIANNFVPPLKTIFSKVFHSESIKEAFGNAVENSAVDGNLSKILREISNLKHLTEDSQGFEEAIKQALIVQYELNSYEDASDILKQAHLSGLRFAHKMGYVLMFIILTFSFFKYF